MKSLVLCWSALLSLGFIFGPNPAHAQAGSLDKTFGKGGIALGNFGSSGGVAAAALQSDGKILVLNANGNFELVRFNANGSVDTTFGSGGSAQVIFASTNTPQALSIQSDGSIVVSGIATNDNTNFQFVAARFSSTGALDSTFGSGGQAATSVPGSLGQGASLIQPDGKIVVAGSTIINPRASTLLAMTRFNADGTLDTAFGTDGWVESSANTFASSVGVDASGNIFVVAGSKIAELDPSGTPLASVTPAAIVSSASGGKNGATLLQANGQYLVGKSVFEGKRDIDLQAQRFTATGAIDNTFQSPTFDFAGEGGTGFGDIADAFALQSDGKILVGASHFSGGFSNELFALARLNSNGTLDSTFGSGGKVTTNVGGMESVNTILLQTDGKIVAIGTANSFSNIALVRYLGN
jgi:uncharacterized delta-60 repeat protein